MSDPRIIRNAADPAQVKAAGDRVQAEEDRQANDLRTVLNTIEGRRFIWRLFAPLDRLSFHSSGSVTAFQEGERNHALKLKAEVVATAPKAYLLMIEEHSKGVQ